MQWVRIQKVLTPAWCGKCIIYDKEHIISTEVTI